MLADKRQRQRQQEPNLLFRKPDAYQVKHQHYEQRPLCEQPDEARRKEQTPIASEMPEGEAGQW